MSTLQLLFRATLLLIPCNADAPSPAEKAIRAVLDAQVAAWNKGDIDGFMKGYWRSEKLTFISGGNITRGWEPTRERYIKKYQAEGKDKMGTLSFDELSIEQLGRSRRSYLGAFGWCAGNEPTRGGSR